RDLLLCEEALRIALRGERAAQYERGVATGPGEPVAVARLLIRPPPLGEQHREQVVDEADIAHAGSFEQRRDLVVMPGLVGSEARVEQCVARCERRPKRGLLPDPPADPLGDAARIHAALDSAPEPVEQSIDVGVAEREEAARAIEPAEPDRAAGLFAQSDREPGGCALH